MDKRGGWCVRKFHSLGTEDGKSMTPELETPHPNWKYCAPMVKTPRGD